MRRARGRWAAMMGLLLIGATAGPLVPSRGDEGDTRTGVQGVVVRIINDGTQPKSFEVEAGDLIEIDYSITAGVGDPRDFTVAVEGEDDAVRVERNLIIKTPVRSAGSTTMAAVLATEKTGKATVTLSVKGGTGESQTYSIRVVDRKNKE
jgi:hypothetical protein